MIWSRAGGSDSGPLLVLLHGLGATADVFAGVETLLADSWPGGWLVVDLPGHGRSSWGAPYSFARHAETVRRLLPRDRELVLLGHSMGGVVALELARGPAPLPTAVVALGVKVRWTEEDVAGAARMAGRPVAHLTSRAEAVSRYLKLAGLTGLVDAGDPTTDAGVVATPEGWRVAQDPATFGVGVPDMAGLLADAECPVLLARGEHDAMVSIPDRAMPWLDGHFGVQGPSRSDDTFDRAGPRPSYSTHRIARACHLEQPWAEDQRGDRRSRAQVPPDLGGRVSEVDSVHAHTHRSLVAVAEERQARSLPDGDWSDRRGRRRGPSERVDGLAVIGVRPSDTIVS